MWLSIILLIGVLVWLIARIGNSRGGRDRTPRIAPKSALDILQERYARGELTHDEYEQMRRDLS